MLYLPTNPATIAKLISRQAIRTVPVGDEADRWNLPDPIYDMLAQRVFDGLLDNNLIQLPHIHTWAEMYGREHGLER